MQVGFLSHFLDVLKAADGDPASLLRGQLNFTTMGAAGHSRGGKIAALHFAGMAERQGCKTCCSPWRFPDGVGHSTCGFFAVNLLHNGSCQDAVCRLWRSGVGHLHASGCRHREGIPSIAHGQGLAQC